MKRIISVLTAAAALCCLCSCNTVKEADSFVMNTGSSDNLDLQTKAVKHNVKAEKNEVSEKEKISIFDCKINAESFMYDGVKEVPDVTISYKNKKLTEKQDYIISAENSSAEIGNYKLTISMTGDYEGTQKLEYSIYPQNTEFTSYSSKVSEITVRWKEQKKADGYEIEYSVNKDLSDAVSVEKGSNNTSLELKDLPQNSIYYFRIRTFIKNNGKKIFSDWSEPFKTAVKKIEIKDGVTYIDGMIIVNKTYSLPRDFGSGEDPQALEAFYQMQNDAAADGLSLYIISGFRSYNTQSFTYNYFCNDRGKEQADRVSARPGHSEHQTGLAFDINSTSYAFTDTPEAKWLAENCNRYGFILRYPEGKEDITGYAYESWHIRFLGTEKAQEIAKSGLTVEEYLGITSKYDE